jgi:hypothetical protein
MDAMGAVDSVEGRVELVPETPTTGSPRKGLLIGGGFCLFFGCYLLAFLLPDMLRAVRGPEPMRLAEAAERAGEETRYVRLEDGSWVCDSIHYVVGRSATDRNVMTTRFTEVFLRDQSRSIAVLVNLSGRQACGDLDKLQPEGYLKRMDAGKRERLTQDARMARMFEAEQFLELCAYCGLENSMIGGLFGMVFFFGGLVLVALGLRMPR